MMKCPDCGHTAYETFVRGAPRLQCRCGFKWELRRFDAPTECPHCEPDYRKCQHCQQSSDDCEKTD